MERLEDYLKPAPRYALLWWLLLLASALATCWVGMALYRHYHELVREQQAVAMLKRASHVKPAPKPSRAELETERQWRALQQELSFSWYPVFAALERTSSPDIALLEFVPDKKTGRLTLRGNAHDMDALTSYLDTLAKEPGFKEVYLAHQKMVQQAGLTVVSFEIRLRFQNQ